MAHGEMLMLGSYTAYVVQEFFAAVCPRPPGLLFLWWPCRYRCWWWGVWGCAWSEVMLRFLYGRPLESLLVTWGIGMIFQQGIRLSLGDQTSVNPPTWFRGGWEAMPGLVLPYSRLFIVVLSLFSVGAVYWMLYRSTLASKSGGHAKPRYRLLYGHLRPPVDALTFAMGTAWRAWPDVH